MNFWLNNIEDQKMYILFSYLFESVFFLYQIFDFYQFSKPIDLIWFEKKWWTDIMSIVSYKNT